MDSACVQDIFTCGICLETFDESTKCPRILSCGHSFCHSCLEKLLAQSPCCPTCKAEILFPITESIPMNFSLKSLINLRSQILMPNTSTNRELGISEQRTNSRKNFSVGYCNEHEYFKELRCMDCEVWICGMCGMQHHKHCRTLLVEEAYTEMKKRASQKVEEELGERSTLTERLTESLRVMEQERRSLIEEIIRKERELTNREKRIAELETLKLEQNKFCGKLKQLQTKIENSSNDVEFSKTLKQLKKLLKEGKKQITVNLHHVYHPQTREALGTLCQNGSVYAVEDRFDSTKYGKVSLKDGRILVTSFQPEKPEDSTLFTFSELLSRFNNGSSELPKTVFLRMTPDGGEVSLEVIIETDGLNRRAKNFILLCSALKGPSYKGRTMEREKKYMRDDDGSSFYEISPGPPPVIEGIGNDDRRTPLKEGGMYGMWKGNSWFWIQLKDETSYRCTKFGVIMAGLQALKDLGGRKCSIEECGLVI